MFECKPKCGECCGIIPIPRVIFDNTKECWTVVPVNLYYVHNRKGKRYVIPETKDGMCIFMYRDTKECSIYKVRPDVCRKYGLIDDLPCPYQNKDGNEWTEQEKYILSVKLTRMREKVLQVVEHGRKMDNGTTKPSAEDVRADEQRTEQHNQDRTE